jgi:uncharacterized protein YfaP (DUF2135 family)
MSINDIPQGETIDHWYSETERELSESPALDVAVIIPSGPPVFSPAAANALLRLLFAVHARRNHDDPATGPESADD